MEITIHTIDEYIKEIFEIYSNNNSNNKCWNSYYHMGLAYRGQTDKNFELLPSIGRDRGYQPSIIHQERNMIEIVKHKLPKVFCQNLPPIDLLAMLQHYGIPTRLLDVTSNPLVALYFATNDEKVDGEVIVFEYNDEYKANYPLYNAIAETYKFADASFISLELFYKNIIIQPYFDEQRISLDNQNDKQGAKWIEDCCKQVFFVEATENLERQRLQQGFYILFHNEITECSENAQFVDRISPIEKNNEVVKKRMIIHKDSKSKLRRDLEVLGISEYTLFSDNIDIVCRGIVDECKKIMR